MQTASTIFYLYNDKQTTLKLFPKQLDWILEDKDLQITNKKHELIHFQTQLKRLHHRL